MEIVFRTKKLRRLCTRDRERVREWGKRRADLIRRRLDQLKAAESLAVLRTFGFGRCHELTGELDGVLSIDLDHPHRLLFEPAHDPRPTKPDGGLDWNLVTAVRILGIGDTHG